MTGKSWAKDLVTAARKQHLSNQRVRRPTPSLDDKTRAELNKFIMHKMLRIDRSERSSAAACIEAGQSTIFSEFVGAEVEVGAAPMEDPDTDPSVADDDEDEIEECGGVGPNGKKTTKCTRPLVLSASLEGANGTGSPSNELSGLEGPKSLEKELTEEELTEFLMNSA